jgi:hypothetical protein
MTTIVARHPETNWQDFHKWLNRYSRGWTYVIPKNQKGIAVYLATGSDSLDWILKSYDIMDYPGFRTVNNIRINYKVKNRDIAMLAKLTWPEIQIWK